MVRVGYVSDEELDFEAVVIAGDDWTTRSKCNVR